MRRVLKSINVETAPWIDLHISPAELRPCHTLTNGQSFSWKKIPSSREDIWIGVLARYPLAIKQTPSSVSYLCLRDDDSMVSDDIHQTITSYFQLEICLADLYQLWSTKCPRLKVVAESIPGVRVLRQDPWECLASFIFSSNNNIKRITKGLEDLRSNYGEYLCSLTVSPETIDVLGEFPDVSGATPGVDLYHLYTFPTPTDLVNKSSEQLLREIGMGYRAKYLYESSKLILSNGGIEWLHSLRNLSYPEIQSTLMTLPGIGRKVADCVALFSLDQIDTIPVDTHIWSITNRDYSSHSQLLLNSPKTLTDKIYQEIQRIFKEIFERHVGWAHSLLFAGELSDFRHLLPIATQEEMKEFERNQREVKKSIKKQKKDLNSESLLSPTEPKPDTKERKKRKIRE